MACGTDANFKEQLYSLEPILIIDYLLLIFKNEVKYDI